MATKYIRIFPAPAPTQTAPFAIFKTLAGSNHEAAASLAQDAQSAAAVDASPSAWSLTRN
jgi:hypothetical protein